MGDWLACPSPAPDAFDPHGTNLQANAHNTESRQLRYAWHPWFGRPVWIHRTLVKSGRPVYRCSLEENQEAPLIEIPQWMFEPDSCCRVRSGEKPVVDLSALLDLKLLLQRARLPACDPVVKAQHHPTPGGADARIGEPIQGSSSRLVSPATPASRLGEATARNQTTGCDTTGANAARTPSENPNWSRKGGRE